MENENIEKNILTSIANIHTNLGLIGEKIDVLERHKEEVRDLVLSLEKKYDDDFDEFKNKILTFIKDTINTCVNSNNENEILTKLAPLYLLKSSTSNTTCDSLINIINVLDGKSEHISYGCIENYSNVDINCFDVMCKHNFFSLDIYKIKYKSNDIINYVVDYERTSKFTKIYESKKDKLKKINDCIIETINDLSAHLKNTKNNNKKEMIKKFDEKITH